MLQQCTQHAPEPAASSVAFDALTSAAQKGLTHEQVVKNVWTKVAEAGVAAELIRIPVGAAQRTARPDEAYSPTAKLLQLCYDYYVVYYTNGTETGRDFLYRECFTADDGGGGSGGGGGGGGGNGSNCREYGDTGPGDGGDSSDIEAMFENLNDPTTILSPGPKPVAEYKDRCAGAQGLWDLGIQNNYVEVFGYLTPTGEIFATAILGSAGGDVGQGLYKFDTGLKISYYYYYPVSQGPPAQTYPGMMVVNGNYYIPVVASIHTHTPCLNDGPDGVSGHELGDDDKAIAPNNPNLRNYIIGCNGTIGSFSTASSFPKVLGSGSLSSTCAKLQ